MAANDHIRQLILALIAPPSLEEEDTEKQVTSIFRDTKVSKRGHIYHQSEYDPPLEPPIEQLISPLPPIQDISFTQAPVDTSQDSIEQAAHPCPECEKMKVLTPAWDNLEDKFIPYNMKKYQARLVELLRRI